MMTRRKRKICILSNYVILYSQYSSIVHKKSSDKAYDGDPETNVGEERPVPGLKQQLKYNKK